MEKGDNNIVLMQISSDENRQTGIAIKRRKGLKYVCSSNMSTKRGQNSQMIKIIFVAVVPMFVLLTQSAIYISQAVQQVTLQKAVRENVSFSMELGLLVHYLQKERGTTALYISSGGNSVVFADLRTKRLHTDTSLESLTSWIAFKDPPYFLTRNTYRAHLQNYRDNLNSSTTTLKENMKFYSDDNDIIISWVGSVVTSSESKTMWQSLTAYHMLLLSKEQAGIERALGSTYFARGSFSLDDLIWYTKTKTLGETYLERSKQYSISVQNDIEGRYMLTDLASEINKMRDQILANNDSVASVMSGILWFDNMTSYINILKIIQEDLAQEIIAGINQNLNQLERDMIINLVQMIVAIILFPIVITLVYHLTKKLQSFANSLCIKTLDLETERQRSEQLLHQMLPPAIAKRMMNGMAVIPENFDSVTIYFSDIVGFTTICSKSTPMQVIHMLNLLYSLMDERLEEFDVYKVETIGDAYMVASGLPVKNKNKHSFEIAMMSLDVMKIVSEATVPHIPEERWKIRIGINTGPVVAGVVGTKMPRYCLFGDTVNVASRMESSGKPSMIQLSTSTKEALEEFPGFVIRERGKITIKGKGAMMTYWLLGYAKDTPRRNLLNETVYKWCQNLDETTTI